MLQDHWFTVEPLDARTYAISEYGHWEKVHSFLLLGDEKAALIDTGIGIDDIKRITDQLTHLPIVVITTHVHWDHIGSHCSFESVYVHKAEKDWLVNGIKGLPIEQIRQDVGRDLTVLPPRTFDAQTYRPFQGEPTGVMHDQDMFDLGNRTLRILHTPGHSPGHVVIHDETNNYLFTGDLLYTDEPIYAFYPTTNPLHLVESLERISKIKHLQKVYGSHHKLGIDPSILKEVAQAVEYLRSNHLIAFGTGIHTFSGFQIQF